MSRSNSENLAPGIMRILMQELKELHSTPPEGISLVPNDADITQIEAIIEGPASTPFEGGLFKVQLRLGPDFPGSPPKGFFVTKIFHPNVDNSGNICVNTLKKDWKPSHGIRHVLLIVKCLLIHPNPESALNEEAGRLLLEEYDEYCKHARLMTSIHASKPPSQDTKPIESEKGFFAPKKTGNKRKVSDKKRALKRL